MNRQRIIALTCHAVACLLFPLATTIGFQVYTDLFGAPFARGAAIGLAAQLIFIVFILTNITIALTSSMKAKVTLACALIISVIVYLLPQHPVRATFYSGLSGALSLAAMYATKKLTCFSQGKQA